jgi:hypothetical protein
MPGVCRAREAYHLGMRRIRPEYVDSSDVLLRQEPAEEEDEEEDEGDANEDDDDEGYTE